MTGGWPVCMGPGLQEWVSDCDAKPEWNVGGGGCGLQRNPGTDHLLCKCKPVTSSSNPSGVFGPELSAERATLTDGRFF